MRKIIIPWQIILLTQIVLIFMIMSDLAHATAVNTQTFDLHPGWNAIYLEVQPEPRTPADVFGVRPEIESVWTWMGGTSSIEFIQDPAEGLASQPGWRVYAASPDKAFLTNLYAIFSNRAYLIKVNGVQPVSLTISGSPRFEPISWLTDSFNLLGFQIDPASPLSFYTFFSPSPAHNNQAMYRLSSRGIWTFIDDPASAVMRSGEAYWVYCFGASKYQGPIAVEVNGNNLDFGKVLMSKTLTIRNLSAAAKAVRLSMVVPQPNIFVYKSVNESTQMIDWLRLEDMAPLSVAAQGTGYVTVGVRREQMSSSQTETLLGIYDDQGVRILIPMSVEK